VRIDTGAWTFLSNGTTGTVNGLAQNDTYRFDIRARNALSTSPTCGTQSGVGTCGRPPQPGTPSLSANQTNNSLNGTWSAVGNVNNCNSTYNVTRYETQLNGAGASSNGTNTSRTWADRSPGDYSFRVRACNTLGCGDYSSVSATRTITPDVGTVAITLGTPNSGDANCWNAGSIRASGGNPNQGCYNIQISMAGWTGNHTVRCFSTMNTGFWKLFDSFTASNGVHQNCGYSQAGRQVVVLVNGNIDGDPHSQMNIPPDGAGSNIWGPWPTN